MSYSYWCPIQFLFVSYSLRVHFSFIPIHFSSFHFQSCSKKVIKKWKELKWSERKGKEKKCSQWSNPDPESPIHLPSVAQEDSLQINWTTLFPTPQLFEGGVLNHFPTLFGFTFTLLDRKLDLEGPVLVIKNPGLGHDVLLGRRLRV